MTPRENEDRKSGESLDLSILVVSYNTFAHTRACLESIFRTTKKIHFEVIVVSPAFAGQPLVKRHQMVYAALGAAVDGTVIHALALKTLTPDQTENV